MPDYSKSIIYTIRTRDGLYVGSTTNFTKRKCSHNCQIRTRNTKLYKTIRDNDGEWDMKPYKEFPCETKQQLNIEEERIRCELKADLNACSCYGHKFNKSESDKKWRENNKEREYQSHKKYREENKEHLKKYHKEWRRKKGIKVRD